MSECQSEGTEGKTSLFPSDANPFFPSFFSALLGVSGIAQLA